MAKRNKPVVAYLHITIGPSSEYIRFEGKTVNGASITLTSKNKVVIGRNPQIADLQIYDLHDASSISRTHCSIRFDFELKHFMITDEASTNGTYLNKHRLSPHEPTQLRDKDIIELGHIDSKGIQFFFALENLNVNETPKRVVVRSDVEPNSTKPLPLMDFPPIDIDKNLFAEIENKQAQQITAMQNNTINLLEEVGKGLIDDTVESAVNKNEAEGLKLLVEGSRLKTQSEHDTTLSNRVQVHTKIISKYDVFISYSRENSDIMKHVYKFLSETHALAVWTDMSLQTGAKWQPEIEKRIADSYCFLILLSPSAKASEWVQNELNYASSYNVMLFPALIEGNEQNAIPIKLIGTQYANLTQDNLETGLTKLANDIKTKLIELKGNTTKK